jgi:general secretion pathway protein D
VLRRLTSLGAAGALALTLAVNSWAQQTWMINFKDSDIQELIKFVADVTGRTVIIDPRVKGRIKVISSKPMDEAELLHMFRTVLEMHDFSMVEVEGVLRIIPLKDARSSPVPVVSGNSSEKGYLTQVIQLQNIAAAKILPSIRPLVPQHSHLSAYDPSNAIIITDSAENIARIRELIERLDKSATPVTEIVELKYANAADLVQVLQSLEKADPNNNNLPNNSLNLTSDKRNNAVLITGEDVQRQRMKSLIERLDRPRAQTGNVRVVYLDYADAKTVAETLTKVMANLSKLGPGGKQENSVAATVEADEDTNALLITASGDDLESLLDVVARLDIRRAQVLVEAIIADIGENDEKNLGIQWLFLDSSKGVFGSSVRGNSGSLARVGAGALALEGSDNSTEAIGGLAGALAGAAGDMLGIVGQNNDNSFLALINALETQGKTNILSTPSLLTMDNHEASFVVGKNIPILTGSSAVTNGLSSPFQTIQRQDVGIKLTVTPQVNEGDTILLTVAQEVSNIDTSVPAEQGFTTIQRKIETKILASDGEIVVLGGLIQDQMDNNEARVPGLGRIPLLGRLFRSDGRSKSRTNLMVFLKVTIVRDSESLAGLTAEKYRYLREQQIKQRDGGFMRRKEKHSPLLPDMEHYNLKLPMMPVDSSDVVVTPAAEAAVDANPNNARR